MSFAQIWDRITGRCLREARQELVDSSQWSADEMRKLIEQAKLNREIAEKDRDLEVIRSTAQAIQGLNGKAVGGEP